MPGRANDLIAIPDSFWQREDTTTALRSHDMGRFFALLHQYTGASQTQIGIACVFSQGTVSDIIRGVQKVEKLDVFERIASGLAMPDPARVNLGLAPRAPSRPTTSAQVSARPIPPRDGRPAPDATEVSHLLSLEPEDRQEEDPVRRRTFVGLTGATLLGAMLADPEGPASTVDGRTLAPILTSHSTDPALAPPGIRALTTAVDNARRQYQECQYAELTKTLPRLLTQLHAACTSFDGDRQLRACALSADAHHVAAGVLLKLDDQGLAYLAADRSIRAAHASQDPVTTGASARIITHTLMKDGHLAAAIDTASRQAAQLDRDVPAHTPESLSVYGALLLRGAVAAAQHGNRAAAYDLLTEADNAGQQLGQDGNLRWTAFGPTNAKLHRVNVAVTLGDAGTAVDVARGIDLNTITVTERKATLLIDTARAFLQWGKHDKAYLALRIAEQTAPEEVTGRPAVHRIVRELVTTAPPTVRRDAEDFARHLGVTR
jgi:hypothetical protein